MDTFDITEAVVSAKNEEIKRDYIIDYEKVDILREYCEVIDVIMKDQNAYEVTANIRDDNCVIIAFKSLDFIYEKGFKSPVYLDLIERAVSMNFTHCDGDHIRTEFVFPSVWTKR